MFLVCMKIKITRYGYTISDSGNIRFLNENQIYEVRKSIAINLVKQNMAVFFNNTTQTKESNYDK